MTTYIAIDRVCCTHVSIMYTCGECNMSKINKVILIFHMHTSKHVSYTKLNNNKTHHDSGLGTHTPTRQDMYTKKKDNKQ